ncbi:MAG: EscU/YscU/HrcU family type III secretion system export apparatus switch protein [Pseudomonadota bacterium]
MADEKTEDATDQKLEKANEEGNFPKSTEFCSAIVFALVLLTLIGGGSLLFDQLRVLIRVGLEFNAQNLSMDELWVKMGVIYTAALWLIVPITLVSAVAGIIGMVAQVGFQVSFKPVEPKLENISPVKGIKKIFSMKSVLELGQMLIRAIIIGAVAYWLIRGAISLFAGVAYQSLPVIGSTAWHLISRLLEFSLLCFFIMSGCDYAIQRWQFMKDQRMSKDEVKREYKESEGDPLIKSERVRLGRENAQGGGGGGGGGLEHAKVILTNPTHYAVAVAYEPGQYDVPIVVARGADDDAKDIRERAAILGIPIFSNPPLARALYKVDVDGQVPKEFFEVLAAILAWLNRINQLNQSRVGMPAVASPSATAPAPVVAGELT